MISAVILVSTSDTHISHAGTDVYIYIGEIVELHDGKDCHPTSGTRQLHVLHACG